MIINYNPLSSGRDTQLKNGVGDRHGGPPGISHKLKRTWWFANMLVLMLLSGFMSAQTTLISPTGDGGFETGTTLAANNWSASTASPDGWVAGNAPTPATGTRCGYVSSNGTTWTYSLSTFSHLYRDFTFPAGQTVATLTFKWKALGEGAGSDWDNMKVYIAPTTVVPSNASAISGATQIFGSGTTSGWYNLSSASWNNETILFAGTPGTTYRLIFSWKSDGFDVFNPPAALDDISLVTRAPIDFTSAATGTWATGATWVGGVAPTAGDNAIIAAGHTVTIGASTGVNNLTVNNTGTVAYATGATLLTVGGNLAVDTGGTVNCFFTTTGKNLSVAGNLTNNGTINLSVATTAASLLTLNGTTAQTVSGSGTFSSNFIRNLTFSNTAAATPNITWNMSGVSVAGTLTFTNGRVALASPLVLGTGATAGTAASSTGALSYTAGGFTSGTFGRWQTAAASGSAITAGAIPSLSSNLGAYPFFSGTNARHFFLTKGASTSGGIISVQHNDVAGINTISSVTDGVYSIDRQSAANWVVTSTGLTAGTAVFGYAASGQGIFTPTNTNTRLMQAAGVVGTHQAGTLLPHVQRTAIAAASYLGTYHLGLSSADIPTMSAQSGPWEDTATWVGGIVPTCGNATVIASGHTVTVNGAAANAGILIVNSGGTLTVSGNTLTVGCTLNNTPLNVNGTLNVSAGSLIINGNLAINNGASFNHTGGQITIDGNDNSGNTANANSIASGTPLFGIGTSATAYATGTTTLTGGTITIVDPHIGNATNTNAYAVYANMASGVNVDAAAAHNLQIGDGASTAAGSSLSGFYVNTSLGSGRLNLGNVTVNTAAGTNRIVTQGGTQGVRGELRVTLGTFSQGTAITNVAGNIVVDNGATMLAGGTTVFCIPTAATTAANTAAQSVSVIGSGAISNLAASPTANFNSITINNTSSTGVTFNALNNLSGLAGFSGASATGTITFTAGGATGTLLCGTSATRGQVAWTAGGMKPGSTFVFGTNASQTYGTVAASTVPGSGGNGTFPLVDAAGNNRNAYISRTTPTGAGVIGITYNDVAGTSTVSIADGAYTVTRRSNGNWTVNTFGTSPTATNYAMAVSAPGVFGLAAPAGGTSRITTAAGVVGVHQVGTNLPHAQRITLTLADITTAPLYIGIDGAEVPVVSLASGDWNNPATWSSGSAPTCGDLVTILNGHNVTVNSASNSTKNVTINTGGTLTVASGDLTVGCTLFNNQVTVNGTLTVSGGNLNVNGNIALPLATSAFNQSGGTIKIDGNNGGSVTGSASAALFGSVSNVINLSGGTMLFVDPGTATTTSTSTGAGMTIWLSSGTAVANTLATSPSHITQFGDGVSTDAGGTTFGFLVDTWENTAHLAFGSVIVNGASGTNRTLNSSYGLSFTGDLTVNAGSTFNSPNFNILGRNLTINAGGTMIVTGQITIAGLASNDSGSVYTNASTNAQTITNNGTLANLASSPTANLAGLGINNSNPAGVTLASPISVGALGLTLGNIHTTSTNYLTLGTTAVAGTLTGGGATSYVDGPMRRTFATRTAAGTYDTTTLFPVGKGAAYLPIHIDPTATGVLAISGEAFTANSGTFNAPITSLSANRWETSAIVGAANFSGARIRLNDAAIVSTNKILQAPSASGLYSAITPSTAFATGTLTTAALIPTAEFTGYFSYGNVTACTVPADQATAFVASSLTTTSFTANYTAAASAPTGYLVVRYPSGGAVTNPADNTSYAAGNTLGAGTVVYFGTALTFNQSGLTANTTYDYRVFSYNNSATCAGPVYNVTTPLLASVTTCATATGTPGTPVASVITTNSMTVTWTASSTSGVSYIIDVATNSGFTTFVSGYQGLSVGSVLTTDLTGLPDSSTLYIRVRAIISGCSSSNSSTLTTATLCTATNVPYIENFNGVTTPALPACTAVINGGTASTNNWATYNAATVSFPSIVLRYQYDFINTSLAADTWFFTRGINMVAGTAYQLKYDYGWTSFTEKLKVAVGTSATIAGMTTTLADHVVTSNLNQGDVTFVAPATGVYYFGFQAHSDANENSLYLDNISVTIPTCLSPSGLTASAITPTSATISWTAPAATTPTQYEYEVRTTGAAGSGGTSPALTASGTVTVPTVSANITGLNPSTTYFVYVRSNCGGGDFGAWTAAYTFTAPCNPVTAFTQNFDAVTVPALPPCWLKIGIDGLANTQSSSSSSTPNCLYMYSSTSTQRPVVTLPPVSNMSTSQLRFKYRGNFSAGETIEVGYLATPGDATSFVALSSVVTESIATYAETTVIPGSIPSNTLAFRTGTATLSVLIDDVVWEPAPTCVPPSGLNASALTVTSATIGWSVPVVGTPASYDYEVRTTGAPGSGGVPPALTASGTVTAPTTSFSVSGLTAQTTYQVYVRSNCGGGDLSAWTAAYTFTTLCNAVSTFPHVEGFDAATLPACWTTENIGGGNDWEPASSNYEIPAPKAGANFASMTLNLDFPNQALLISPTYDHTANPTQVLRINVWVYRNATATIDGVTGTVNDRTTFFVNTTNSLAGATQLLDIPVRADLAPVVASNGWYNYTVNVPASFNAAPFYIVVKGNMAYDPNTLDLGFDEYRLEVAPPSITSFTPASVCAGGTAGERTVVLTGVNFTSVSSVKYNGLDVASYTVDSATQITAVIPGVVNAGATLSVTTPLGTATSATNLIVKASPNVPAITPATVTLCVGDQVQLANAFVGGGGDWGISSGSSVTLDDNEGNFTAVAGGATTVTYTVTNNGCTTTVSRVINVNTPIDNVGSPSDVVVTTDAPASFTVVSVSPAGPTGDIVGYQWYVCTDPEAEEQVFTPVSNGTIPSNSGVVSGATTATLSISKAPAEWNGYLYKVIIDAVAPCVDYESSPASLNVGALGIVTQPQPVSECTTGDGEAVFTIVTSGAVTSYEWQQNDGITGYQPLTNGTVSGITYAGTDTDTLIISDITTDISGFTYRVKLTGLTVVNSNGASLTVSEGVAITTDPVAQTACGSGEANVFTVAASGNVSNYTWQFSTSTGGPWSTVANNTPLGVNYTNATSASLTVTNTNPATLGTFYYRALANGIAPCPSDPSEPASLIISSPTVVITPSSATYCNPGAGVTLTASGAVSYTWNPTTDLVISGTGNNTAVASPTVTRTYNVTGVDSNGCSSTTSVTVTATTGVSASATVSKTVVCPGDAITLTAAGVTGAFTTGNIGAYNFAKSTGNTYSDLTGATTFPVDGAASYIDGNTPQDDAYSTLQNIGFNFNFGGTDFTQFSVGSNGYLRLGALPTIDWEFTGDYNVFGNTDTNIIAFNNRDLDNAGAVYSYVIEGTAPSRICKIQAKNFYQWLSSGATTHKGNAQVWLYEGSNKIELRYGTYTTTWTNASAARIGLKSISNAAANIRTVSGTTWTGAVASTSSTATVTQNGATQVTNGTVFAFTPGNSPTYTYAWSASPADATLTNANSAIATANPAVATTYTVVVSSNTCSNSASVGITTQSGVVFNTSPVATTTKCQGESVTFSVTATGPNLSYQWRKGTTNINGGTNPSALTNELTLTGLTPADSGSYNVVVTPGCGPIGTSSDAVLTVNPTPTVTAPANQAFCAGTAVPATALTGTPSGVTFDISGGASIGLANQTGVTQVPAFTAVEGYATISITPKANGCTGTAVTYTIAINGVPTALSVNPPTATNCANGTPVLLTAVGGVVTPSGYCIPEMTDVSASEDYLNDFSFAGIVNNGSGDTASDYTYYNMTANVVAGTSYPVSLTPGSEDYGEQFRIWIDMNHDGEFSSDESVFNTDESYYAPDAATGDITVPTTAYNGLTRMRVATRYSSTPSDEAYCLGDSDYGEFEDYNVVITGGVAPIGKAVWTNGGAGVYTGLYSDAAGNTAYDGTPSNTVYARPTSNATITATVTGATPTNCSKFATSVITVNPAAVVVAPATQTVCSGTLTSPIVVSGTPSGVLFDITGGSSIGLSDQTNQTTIPAFTATGTSAVITLTPHTATCSGTPVTFIINVSPATVAGSVSGAGAAACAGATSGVLTLSGHTGAVVRWESSVAPFTVWNTIANTNATYTSGPLTQTTQFRAVVKSGACSEAASSSATVTINQVTLSSISSPQVCVNGETTITMNGLVPSSTSTVTYSRGGVTQPTVVVTANASGVGSFNMIVTGASQNVTILSVLRTDATPNCTLVPSSGNSITLVSSTGCTSLSTCGWMLSAIDQSLYANIVSGAQAYRWRVTRLEADGITPTTEVQTLDSTLRTMKLTQLAQFRFNTTYRVEVATMRLSVWGPYGQPCTATTPVATTALMSCGTPASPAAMTSISDIIYANLVPFATGYRFRITDPTNGANTQTLDRNVREFRMNLITTFTVQYNKNYNVEIAVRNTDGTYLPYNSTVCVVRTPSFPTTSIQDSQCEDYAVPTSTTQIYAYSYPAAVAYAFQLTGPTLPGGPNYPAGVELVKSTRQFSLNDFPGLIAGATYVVKVRLIFNLNDPAGPYGKPCSVVTPGLSRTVEVETKFNAVAYPNPFADNFNIDVTTSAEENVNVKVYDMTGRLLETHNVHVAEMESLKVGDRFPSGVYNVIVSQGENVRTLRVVKR